MHPIECQICRNEAPSVTLMRYDLWPASPTQPKVAFQIAVMELQQVLQLEAQVSLKAFCDMVKQLSLAADMVSK